MYVLENIHLYADDSTIFTLISGPDFTLQTKIVVLFKHIYRKNILLSNNKPLVATEASPCYLIMIFVNRE